MIDKKNTYEAPKVQVFVVKMDGGILQSSLEATRKGYGEAIPGEWLLMN